MLQRDDGSLLKADERGVGFAGQQDTGQLGEVWEVPDQHRVAGRFGKSTRPCRRVIVGGRASPGSGLTSASWPPDLWVFEGRVSCRGGSGAEPVDGPLRHPRRVVGAAVGERPLRVFVLTFGLSMLDQVDDCGRDGTCRARTRCPAGPSDHQAAVEGCSRAVSQSAKTSRVS